MSTTPVFTRSYHHDLDPAHVCGDEDIADLLRELDGLDRDPNLARYEDPDVETMRAILDDAAIYTGPWYHAHVLFDMEAEISPAYEALRTALLELPAECGVNVVRHYDWPLLPEVWQQDYEPV